MLFTSFTTLLALATSVSAAAVCPPGPTRFKIHPASRPDLCVSCKPDFYYTEYFAYPSDFIVVTNYLLVYQPIWGHGYTCRCDAGVTCELTL
jgi:hypothetical protein